MSALAAYFGAQKVSILLEYPSGYIEFFEFPYVYSPELFSNYCTSEEFYKSFFDIFLKERKVKMADVDFLVTGFMDTPKLWIKPKYSADLMTVLNSVADFDPVLANNFSILVKDKIYSYAPNTESDGDLDYYANLSIYPQLIPGEISTQIDIDQTVSVPLGQEGLKTEKDVPLIFTGCRFGKLTPNPELNYVFMFNLIKQAGFHELFLDQNNAVILLQLLKLYRPDFEPSFKTRVEQVGTLISTTGSTECLLTSDVGTSQFFEIEDNTIYIVPLGAEVKAKLNIKNHEFGNMEKTVTGGRVGLIFDTRQNKNSITSEVKIFNSCVKQLNEILCTKVN